MNNIASIRVLYFAWLREKIGHEQETTPLATPTLAHEVLDRLALISPNHANALADRVPLRIAINKTLCSFDAVVHPGDELAIFPPVTGG